MKMDRDRLLAIKEMAALHIEEILEALDVNYRDRYNYIVGACPIHAGADNKNAWSYHIDRGIWSCFSHGCHDEYGADIFGLVRGINRCGFNEAVEFVVKFVGDNISVEEIKRLKDQRENRDFIKSALAKSFTPRIFSKDSVKKLTYHGYLESRGYPKWLVEKYQIGACLEPYKYMSGRIVVPVCNVSDEIVGFTGRTLDPSWESKGIPKWKHSKGEWVNCNLFNINNAVSAIRETGHAIICEGPLDVLRLEEAGIPNGVALLGKKLHPGQTTLLIQVGATTLVDGLDTDVAGRVGGMGLARNPLFDYKEIKLPEGRKDLGEMKADEIRGVFDGIFSVISC